MRDLNSGFDVYKEDFTMDACSLGKASRRSGFGVWGWGFREIFQFEICSTAKIFQLERLDNAKRTCHIKTNRQVQAGLGLRVEDFGFKLEEFRSVETVAHQVLLCTFLKFYLDEDL